MTLLALPFEERRDLQHFKQHVFMHGKQQTMMNTKRTHHKSSSQHIVLRMHTMLKLHGANTFKTAQPLCILIDLQIARFPTIGFFVILRLFAFLFWDISPLRTSVFLEGCSCEVYMSHVSFLENRVE
eukprot:gb/GECG01007132.1/.p1 GENE.gb/GECG01007132.1/~~gb/GECG01007132.1/.p1  ORF type:complete len:127 (+),score=7.57 gb/GECG01007132.1/:1-381(+)